MYIPLTKTHAKGKHMPLTNMACADIIVPEAISDIQFIVVRQGQQLAESRDHRI